MGRRQTKPNYYRITDVSSKKEWRVDSLEVIEKIDVQRIHFVAHHVHKSQV